MPDFVIAFCGKPRAVLWRYDEIGGGVTMVFSFLPLANRGHRGYYPPIIMYHSLTPGRRDTSAVSMQAFIRHMEFIKARKYNVLSLYELARIIRKGKMPRKIVVITADDGYKDNVEMGKVLKEFGFPATIFMIAGYIGKEGFMDEEDLRFLDKYTPVEIGAHTVNHAYLPEAKDIETEVVRSKEILERVLGHTIGCFSYPVGGYNRDIQKIVRKAGFSCAVTTNRGYEKEMDLYGIRRIKVTERDIGIILRAKLSGYYDLFRKLKYPQ